MKEETLERLLREADGASGGAPRATLEGVRRARRGWVVRRVVGCAVVGMVVIGGAARLREGTERRGERRRMEAEVAGIRREIAVAEARVGELLAAEREKAERVELGLAPERRITERLAGGELLAIEAATGDGAAYRKLRAAYPGTVASERAAAALLREGANR